MPSSTYATIDVEPLAPAVGAVIGGVDIAADLSDETFAEIRQAFIDHGVIFFHDQDLTPEQHLAFAERWGEININRFFNPVEGYPRIAEVRKEPEQDRNIGVNWHTDHSYDQIPAMGSILYAREVPVEGGDTLFASMYAAYEALPEDLKTKLLSMRGEHTSRRTFGRLAELADDEDADIGGRLGNPEAATQDAVHPVVIKHPLSGRPALYVNRDFTIGFEGWSEDESQPLLEELFEHACRDEFTGRFSWDVGSIAIWDNRAVHHRALNDYHGHLRLMHRITIEGEPLSAA